MVESDISSVAPSWPIFSSVALSNSSPSTGFSSILQSPVWTIVPLSLLRMHPMQSGMLCVTRKDSSSKGPTGNFEPTSKVLNRCGCHRLYSFIRLSTRFITNLVA